VFLAVEVVMVSDASVLVSGVTDRIGSVLVSGSVNVSGLERESGSGQKMMGMMIQSSSRNRRIPVLTSSRYLLGCGVGDALGGVRGWKEGREEYAKTLGGQKGNGDTDAIQ